jgi:glucose-1-phosphate thymidylyltransferase
MKAIIPAAGMGSRLQPHTDNRPKVMVPIAGKPILEHISESLFKAGFDKISVIVGYKKEAVIDYFSKNYPGKFDFPVQKEMKGIAHAVLYALEDVDEPALIILGDTIIDLDMEKLKDPKHNVIGVVRVDDPSRFGIVETDKRGFITNMVEKPEYPKSDLAIAGAYFIQSQRTLKFAIEELIKNDVKTRNEYQLTDALSLMMKTGESFKALPINKWYDCGTVETLLSTSAYLMSLLSVNEGDCENCKIIEPVYIAKGAKISNSTIGPNVAIGKNALVADSTISDSILNDGAELKNTCTKHSIIGYYARIDNVQSDYLSIEDKKVIVDNTKRV